MEKTITKGCYTLKIVQDQMPSSPREWDNLGTLIFFSRRYTSPDEHDFSDPRDFEEYLEEEGDRVICFPVYAYEHGGIVLSLGQFSCSWDSGQIGFIYVEREAVLKEFGWKRMNAKRVDRIRELLSGEVKTYEQYLMGDTWGAIITQNGEDVDSCWGYYGMDIAIAEGQDMLDYLADRDREPIVKVEDNDFYFDPLQQQGLRQIAAVKLRGYHIADLHTTFTAKGTQENWIFTWNLTEDQVNKLAKDLGGVIRPAEYSENHFWFSTSLSAYALEFARRLFNWYYAKGGELEKQEAAAKNAEVPHD